MQQSVSIPEGLERAAAIPPGSRLQEGSLPAVSLRSKTTLRDTSRKNQTHRRAATADDGFVDVTDPTHPLFQRKFELLSVSRSSRGTAQVTVRYRGDNSLQLPLRCTNLSDLGKNTLRSKLTGQAARDLLALVKEYQPCPRRPRKSGEASHSMRDKKSSKNSTASSRR